MIFSREAKSSQVMPQSQQASVTAAHRRRPMRMGELLVSRGLLTQEQLDRALELQKTSNPPKLLGSVLIESGMVTDEQLTMTIAHSVGVPFVVVTAAMIKGEALDVLTPEFMHKHNVLPMSVADGWLTVAMEEFTDVFLRGEIGRITGMEVQVVAATGKNIRELRAVVAPVAESAADDPVAGTELATEMLDELGASLTVVEEREEQEVADLASAASDSPVIKLVNYIVHNGVVQRASDIHIEPEGETFRVRYRIDGDLTEVLHPPGKLLPAVVSRIKILSKLDISERRQPQDGGMTVMVANRQIDLRVSTMPTKFGEKVVMRIVDHNAGMLKLDTLGLCDRILEKFRIVIGEASGIVLVTGPTGSGKSTTLYAAIGEIAAPRYNISTVEDPVEFNLKGINQFQVNPKAGFTFPRALRALLRQDPDVIMVGEIRDVETAKLATEAALTGHLVLSTLHTNDALTAVPRLINMGVEPYLVAASLRGILAQRLVRKVCAQCKKETPIDGDARAALMRMYGGMCPVETVYRGEGCARCRGSGFAGRVGIHEFLMLNEVLLSAVARDASMHNIRDIARQQGFKTMLEDGLTKVQAGLITLEGLLEAVARSDDTTMAAPHADDPDIAAIAKGA